MNKKWLITETGNAIRFDKIDAVFLSSASYNSKHDYIMVAVNKHNFLVKSIPKQFLPNGFENIGANKEQIDQIINDIINGNKINYQE